jgi:hypothetical protein
MRVMSESETAWGTFGFRWPWGEDWWLTQPGKGLVYFFPVPFSYGTVHWT